MYSSRHLNIGSESLLVLHVPFDHGDEARSVVISQKYTHSSRVRQASSSQPSKSENEKSIRPERNIVCVTEYRYNSPILLPPYLVRDLLPFGLWRPAPRALSMPLPKLTRSVRALLLSRHFRHAHHGHALLSLLHLASFYFHSIRLSSVALQAHFLAVPQLDLDESLRCGLEKRFSAYSTNIDIHDSDVSYRSTEKSSGVTRFRSILVTIVSGAR